MKTLKIQLITFLTLLAVPALHSQAPFPIESGSQVWEYVTWYFWGGKCESRIVRIGDQSIQCNQAYYEVVDCREDGSRCRVLGYVRNQNDSIMTRVNHERLYNVYDTVACKDGEGLMYYYDIANFDTISCQLNDRYPPSQQPFWSVRQDQVDYLGVERKTITMDYHPYPTLNIPNIPDRIRQMQWIEGIGSTTHPFYSLVCFGGGCERENKLMRVFRDGKLIYEDADLSSWYSCTDWIRCDSHEQQDLIVYPNPVKHSFRLKSLKYLGNSFKMQIYNMQGQMVLNIDQHWMNDQVDIQSFASGAYVIQLNDGTQFLTTKFIKF